MVQCCSPACLHAQWFVKLRRESVPTPKTTSRCHVGDAACLSACRYAGTDVAVMTSWQEGSDPAAAFAAAYQREFGFVLDRPVVVDDVRVRATGRAADLPHIQVGCYLWCCDMSAAVATHGSFVGCLGMKLAKNPQEYASNHNLLHHHCCRSCRAARRLRCQPPPPPRTPTLTAWAGCPPLCTCWTAWWGDSSCRGLRC